MDKVNKNNEQLSKLLVRAHVEAGKAWELGASEKQMKGILQNIRSAQWRWDYVAASHGAPFHAPIECLRVIGDGIDKAQEARLKLSRVLASLGHNKEVPYPDISTKAKAQAYIGLDMDKLRAEKEKFLEKVVPRWDSVAQQREKTYDEIYREN
jgi:nitrite reductase (cytochrome c-552)